MPSRTRNMVGTRDGRALLLGRRISRRAGMRAGLLSVAGLLAAVLAACGGGDDEEEEEDDD